MLRTRPLFAAVLCTAALAACSDATTGTDRGGDALVNATNRNLPADIVFAATQSENLTRGLATGPSSVCYQPYDYPAYSVSGTGAEAYYEPCYPREPIDPEEPVEPAPPPPPPVTQPTFATPVATITGSTSLGTKTVKLNASGGFTYASFGQLTAIFQNIGGCPTTAPAEYSRSVVTGQNGPFTLASSRSASYNGTTSQIKWGVRATSYAESPEGGSASKISTKAFCY